MDTWLQFFIDHAPYAHYLIFSLLLLAGFNVPISEDIMVIISACLAANVVPENTMILFVATFLGCYLSDWICYGIGRSLGRRLWDIPWFAKTFSKKRLLQTQNFYKKYGFFTLLVGRLIPFGVRNCLFLSAGMGKMSFLRFIISDGIACLFSNSVLFFIVYNSNKNIYTFFTYLKKFNFIIFSIFIVTIIAIFWYKRRKPADFTQNF